MAPTGLRWRRNALGEWTLIVEDNGYLATCRETVVPLSAGRHRRLRRPLEHDRLALLVVVDGTVVRGFGQDDARAGTKMNSPAVACLRRRDWTWTYTATVPADWH